MAGTTDTTTESAAKSTTARRSRAGKSTAPTSTANGAGASAGGEFTCPECGRSFQRAAALGAHRRTHGVVGKKASAAKGRAARSGAKTTSRRRSSRSGGSTAARTARRSNGGQGASSIDRDALLQALFPNGVPARGEALSAVSAWLDEAERLARMR